MSHPEHPALTTCSFCPRLCRHVCPTALGESRETLTPTMKMSLVSLWKQGHLPFDQDMAEVLYACTDCGGCTAHCKHGMTPAEVLYQERQEIFRQGVVPDSVTQLIERFHAHGNPYGSLPQEYESEPEPVQLLPGCASWYHQPDETQLLGRLFLSMQPGQRASVCSSEYCCGAPLYATGNLAVHRQHAHTFIQKHRHLHSLVVADPHCARHLQVRYPQVGIHLPFRVVLLLHTFSPSFLDTLPPSATSQTPVFYLDPSPLGRHAGIYDLPRQILQRLSYEVLEFSYHHFLALDSAAGGIYRWTSPEGALHYARWLLQEVRDVARQRGLSTIPPVVTVGETERSHLAAANPDLEILDLYTLVAKAVLKT